MAERNEINAVISEEMKNISSALLQLGQAYYEKHSFDFEPEFETIIASIKDSEARITSICLQPQVEAEAVPEYDDTVPVAATVEAIEEISEASEINGEIPVMPVSDPVMVAAPVMPVAEPVVEPAPVASVTEPIAEPDPEYCIKCGAVYEKDAAFCNTCGAPKSVPVNDSLIMCPTCKQMIRPGTNFCTSCGSVMPSAMPASNPVSEHIVESVPAMPVAPVEIPAPPVEEMIFTPSEEEEVPPVSAEPQTKTCPLCGAPIIQEGLFCTACGGRLG